MKTARAIEPNAGTRREYAKRVNRLVNQFLDLMTDEIILHVADAGDLVAQDWSLSKPTRKADREKLRRIRARVLAAWKRDPAAFAADIDDYVSRNIVRWTGYLDRSAEKLAQWVARSIAADVTNAQKQAYLSAGISPEVFKDKWTIPVVRQHISPTAARLIPSIVEESVGNIESGTVQGLAPATGHHRRPRARAYGFQGQANAQVFRRVRREHRDELGD